MQCVASCCTGLQGFSGRVRRLVVFLPHSAVLEADVKSDGQQPSSPEPAATAGIGVAATARAPPGFHARFGAGEVLVGAPVGLGLVATEKTAVSGLYLRLKTEDVSLRRELLMTPLVETEKGRAHGLRITERP